MLLCVWLSYTSRTIEQINAIDDAKLQGLSVSPGVDECCRQLEAVMTDWNTEAVLNNTSVKYQIRCIVADHTMNIYATIIGLKRLANRIDEISTVDATTIRAARKIVGTLLDFETGGCTGGRGSKGSENYFIQ